MGATGDPGDIAGQIERIRTDDELRPIVAALRHAVDRYLEAVRRGAALYNEAAVQLQAARLGAGLPTTDEFPDHPAGG